MGKGKTEAAGGGVGIESWPARSVEMRNLAELVPYARNSRTHSTAQVKEIAASMRQWGWTIPILVDENGMILAGHARVKAAGLLGLQDAPVMVARGWTEDQKKAYIIADNKLAENAGWDKDLLKVELAELDAAGFDLGLTGFSQDELIRLLNGGGQTDPDALPEAPEPQAAVGDVWCLGRHRLLCGDSTVATDVDKVLAGVVPFLMVTDPPYGVNYDASWRVDSGLTKATARGKVKNDSECDWREAWALFPGAVAYVWHASRYCGRVQDSLEICKFEIRAQIVWVKVRPIISRGHYHFQHEPAFYAVKEDAADDRWRFREEDHELSAYAVRGGETAHWMGGRKQSTVWFVEHMKNESGHSTQKPVECMKRPMLNHCSVGDAVYDPFMGSGTSIIAAEMAGLVCYGIELNPAYVDLAVKRWEDFTGQKATLEKAN